ncbi:MAG: hypothetical protein CMB74_04075 [Euryarchaeota archaeon]|nr:hypothetical protein [Euryarchaeota archaeon]|tara:strand:+ start:679 stop:1497 length:819 start_codon:yes stop_codon:yes gene_type:complete
MRRTAVIALILVAMLLVPVQAGDVTVQQEQQEDPRQPNANNTTMYIYHDGFADAWSHFNSSDEESNTEGEFREEKDNGLININLRFRMKPDLNKQLLMEENGEFRGNFKIDVGGDWTNGDNNGPCNNDCENLTITVFRGGAEVWSNEFTGIQQGEQNVPFAFAVTEDHMVWDGRDDNPIIEVTMKVKGNRQNTGPGGVFLEGDPAWFAIKLGTESRFELPIDPQSWEEGFEINDDDMFDDMEDTPGFTLVAASAALGMALFVNQRRANEDEA